MSTSEKKETFKASKVAIDRGIDLYAKTETKSERKQKELSAKKPLHSTANFLDAFENEIEKTSDTTNSDRKRRYPSHKDSSSIFDSKTNSSSTSHRSKRESNLHIKSDLRVEKHAFSIDSRFHKDKDDINFNARNTTVYSQGSYYNRDYDRGNFSRQSRHFQQFEKEREPPPLVIDYNHVSLKSILNSHMSEFNKRFSNDRNREDFWNRNNGSNYYNKNNTNELTLNIRKNDYQKQKDYGFEPQRLRQYSHNSPKYREYNYYSQRPREDVYESQMQNNYNYNSQRYREHNFESERQKYLNRNLENKNFIDTRVVCDAGYQSHSNREQVHRNDFDKNKQENSSNMDILTWRIKPSTADYEELYSSLYSTHNNSSGEHSNSNLSFQRHSNMNMSEKGYDNIGDENVKGKSKGWYFLQDDAQTKLVSSRKEAIFPSGVDFSLTQRQIHIEDPAVVEERERQQKIKEFHARWLYLKSTNSMQQYDTQSDSEKSKLDDSNLMIDYLPDRFLIEAIDIQVLKKVILEEALSYTDVENFCQMDAQYFYYQATVDKEFALENSKKKGEKQLMSGYCSVCNLVFPTQDVLNNHYSTKNHQQLERIYKELYDIAVKWFEAKTYDMTEKSKTEEEENGLTIDLAPSKMKSVTSKADIAIPDDFYQEFDVKSMKVREFVQKASAKRMALIWPKPKLEYFCKVCNYIEFSTKELLDRHLQSSSHMEFQSRMKQTFCKICQHNYDDVESYKNHLNTDAHRMADKLYEEVRIHATKYWNLISLNYPEDQSMLVLKRSQLQEKSEEQIAKEKMKDQEVLGRLFQEKPDDFKLIENFLTDEGCQLCNKAFPPVQSVIESHVKSKKHQKKFRQYLEDNKDEFLTPGGCMLCEMSFPCIDPVIIAAHRLSKKHVAKRKAYFFG